VVVKDDKIAAYRVNFEIIFLLADSWCTWTALTEKEADNSSAPPCPWRLSWGRP